MDEAALDAELSCEDAALWAAAEPDEADETSLS